MLYHLVPTGGFRGGTIYSLNMLKTTYPDLYFKEIQKYEGRMEVLNAPVPSLGCRWGDVIFLSPVDPRLLRHEQYLVGIVPSRNEWGTCLEFSPEVLRPSCLATVWMHESDDSEDSTQYRTYAPDLLPSIDFVPEATKKYYRDRARDGQRALLYPYVPHVLYRGCLNVNREASVFEV